MTDGGAAYQPGQTGPSLPFRPRGAYAGHEAFGAGSGAVLVDPEVARDLRTAAEFATQERRIAGGLLYGRGWVDDEGPYLVVDGFLEAGPGENPGDRIGADGYDDFTLSNADLRLLREDAARMYSAALEVGWWRSLAAAGEFGPRDYLTQRDLIEPGGVGLLVFGSGLAWGTAYLGPDADAPGSAGSLVPVPRLAAELEPEPELAPAPLNAIVPGTVIATRQPSLTPAPQPGGPRVISPIAVPSREWGARPAAPGNVESRMPTDVKLVVGAIVVVSIVAAVIIGVLLASAVIAVIVAVVCLLALSVFLWLSRL
jgi:hypothetical protein